MKAVADEHFAGLPLTRLLTSYYWDNLYLFGLAPQKGEDGSLSWAFPMGDARLAGIAAEDIGKVAYGIFKAGDQYIGKTVGIYGEALTIEQAEGVRVSLRDTLAKTTELVRSLKQHRKISKTVQSALSSLRDLQQVGG